MVKHTETNKRNNALDFLRIFACIGIVWLHYRTYASPNGVFWGDILINQQNTGIDLRLFVELFFVLSGYLSFRYVNRIKKGQKLTDFIKPRLVRILPLLIVSTVLYQLLLYILTRQGLTPWPNYVQPSLWAMLSSCLGIQEGWSFTYTGINSASWFLNILILCYFIFYFIVWLCNKMDVDSKWGYFVIILIGAACVNRETSLPFLDYMNGRGYEAFFTGVILADIRKHHVPGIRCYIICFAILIIYGGYHVFFPHLLLFGNYYVMAFIVSPAMIIIMESETAKKIFGWNGWSFLGKITFSTYCLHVCAILGVLNIQDALGLKIDFGHEIVLCAFLIFAFCIGAIGYYLIEQPLYRWLSGKEERSSVSDKGDNA